MQANDDCFLMSLWILLASGVFKNFRHHNYDAALEEAVVNVGDQGDDLTLRDHGDDLKDENYKDIRLTNLNDSYSGKIDR